MHPLDNEALKLGAKAVRRRRLDAENRQDFISLLGRVVVILLCAWVLFTQVFLLTQSKGSSMFPAVKDGDLLICYRLQKTYAKNDVVVYTQGVFCVGGVEDLAALHRAVHHKGAAVVQSHKVALAPKDAAHPELAALGVDHNVVFCVGFLQAVADEQVAILYRGEHAAALGLREQEHLREQHPGTQQDHHNAAQQASSGWAASLGARATLWLWTTAAPLW